MNVTTQTETMRLDDEAKPSQADMTDIISALTPNDDNGKLFQSVCDASVDFPSRTNEEFQAACIAWLSTRS